GIYWIGHTGNDFAFDNEEPRHREFIPSFHLASRLVTNADYLAFMHDAGYARPDLWLSLGWATVQQEGWRAPLYWEERDGQWWQSSYSPYPGFRTAPGALGEYNGKFMCNQYVLRGGSCATPRSHIRPTYRNFFPPEARWQFSGLRVAQDA